MTDWIDKEKQKRERIRKIEEGYAEVYPSKARQFWESLVATLRYDIARLNNDLGYSIEIDEGTSSGHFGFHKPAYPIFDVNIYLDINARSIRINQERTALSSKLGPMGVERYIDRSPYPYTETLGLHLDDQNRIYVYRYRELSVGEISEFILRPILLGFSRSNR